MPAIGRLGLIALDGCKSLKMLFITKPRNDKKYTDHGHSSAHFTWSIPPGIRNSHAFRFLPSFHLHYSRNWLTQFHSARIFFHYLMMRPRVQSEFRLDSSYLQDCERWLAWSWKVASSLRPFAPFLFVCLFLVSFASCVCLFFRFCFLLLFF